MVNNMILWSCISANFEGFKPAQALDLTWTVCAPR